MDKQLIERIALEEAQEFFSMATTNPLVFKCHIPEFATRFLARIDAERGKEAVAKLHVTLEDDGLEGRVEILNGEHLQVADSPILLFLSAPPIPEGMVLMPSSLSDDMQFAMAKYVSGGDFYAAYRAMLAAAQGERNVD